jgi:hypothetical protein
MAPTPVAQGSPGGGGADILTAEEFGARVHIRRVRTVTDLCASGEVPGASKIGKEWRVHWPTFYEAVAGPGVPDGDVVNSTELARRLRVSDRVVRRASAAPGTPGKLPGLQVGKTWLHAMPAVHAQVGWSQEGGQDAAIPAQAQRATPRTIQSLDFPATAPGQAPPARGPARGAGTAARRRHQPGAGSSPSPR